MAYNYEYPYTDPNRYNSDWLLNAMRKLQEEWNIFVPTHEVKFGGIWDGTKTYGAYTIVSDNALNSYISRVAVPAGVQITDEHYWVQIGSYNAQITQEIENAVKQIQEDTPSSALKLGKRKFIFISDSYGVLTISDGRNWIKLLCDQCGISRSNVTELCRGSSGFTQPNERKWLNMLTDAGITNKEEITDIFVGGGANDVAADTGTVLNAISEFMSYVKANYPNATVWLAHFGLTFTVSNMSRRYVTSLSAYRNASLYGARYVYNSEYILCDNTLLEADKVHPNELGILTLSNALTKAIFTGRCDVHYLCSSTMTLSGNSPLSQAGATVIGGALYKLDNNGVTIIANNGIFATILYTEPVNTLDIPNNEYTKLFSLSQVYTLGSDGNRKTINGFVRFWIGGTIKIVPCTYYLEDWGEGLPTIGVMLYNETTITNINRADFVIGGNYLPADM